MDKNLDLTTIQCISEQKGKVIALLRLVGSEGATTLDFKQLNIHHTDRISKLRREGYVIDCTKLSDTIYRYILVSEPTEKLVPVNSVEKFITEWNKHFPNKPIDVDEVREILDETGLNIVTHKGGFKNL